MKAVASFNVPTSFMTILKGLYSNPHFYVEVDGHKSEEAKQNTGIRQGCPLSSYLFIMVMDCIFGAIPKVSEAISAQTFNVKENEKACENVEGMGLSFNALLYADDTLLVTAAGHSMEVLLWGGCRVSLD